MTTAVDHPTHLTPARTADLRPAGLAGVLAAVALTAAMLLLPVDDGGATPGDIAARYADGSAGYLRSVLLEFGSLALTAVLAAGLCTWAMRRSPVAAVAAALGAALLLTCQLLGYAVIATLALGTAGDGGLDVVMALYDMSTLAFAASSVGLTVMTTAVAVHAWHGHRVLGAWSVVTAVAGVAGAASIQPTGLLAAHGDLSFLVVVLQMAWTLAAGVTLLRTGRAGAGAPTS